MKQIALQLIAATSVEGHNGQVRLMLALLTSDELEAIKTILIQTEYRISISKRQPIVELTMLIDLIGEEMQNN